MFNYLATTQKELKIKTSSNLNTELSFKPKALKRKANKIYFTSKDYKTNFLLSSVKQVDIEIMTIEIKFKEDKAQIRCTIKPLIYLFSLLIYIPVASFFLYITFKGVLNGYPLSIQVPFMGSPILIPMSIYFICKLITYEKCKQIYNSQRWIVKAFHRLADEIKEKRPHNNV